MKFNALLASVVVAQAKKYEDTSYECPDGYDFIDKYTCQKRVVIPVELKCPAGCDRVEDKGRIICVDDDSRSPRRSCPQSFHLDRNGECVKISRTEVSESCPRGFHFDEFKKCRKEEMFPLDFRCPRGEKHGDGCLFVEHGEVKFGCPPDFHFDGSTCVKKDLIDLEKYCPDEFWLEGKACVRHIHQNVEWRCPEHSWQHPHDPDRCATGSDTPAEKKCGISGRSEEECFWIDYKEKTKACPIGFSQSHIKAGDGGDLCEKCNDRKKTTSRCEYKPADMVCPSDYYNTGHKCEKKIWGNFDHYCKTGSLKWIDGKAVCSSHQKIDKFKWCPENSHREGKSCIGKEYSELLWKCPNHYEQKNDKCVMYKSEPQSKYCEFGDYENGKCLIKTVYPGEYFCPRDSHRVEDTCVRREYRAIIKDCPKEYFYSEDGICYKTIRRPALEKCQDGSDPATNEDGSTVCVSTQLCEPRRNCPWRFELEDDVCVRTHTTKARTDYRGHHGGHHGHHGHR